MTNKEELRRIVTIGLKTLMEDNIHVCAIEQRFKSGCKIILEQISKNLDWNDIDEETCQILGFGKWEEGNSLRLIPTYLYPIIPNGLKVQDICGKIEEFYQGMDNDSRCGCLAYGINYVNKN